MNNNNLAKQIIKENIYLSIATMGKKPWVAAIRYKVDKLYNFYFASKQDTIHVAHILKESMTACGIFDSHQEDGTGQGIQMEGKTVLLDGEELKKAVKLFWPEKIEKMVDNFSGVSIYRFFKFTPEHVFVLDPTDIAVDRRVEVML